jgi:hypothetical protein
MLRQLSASVEGTFLPSRSLWPRSTNWRETKMKTRITLTAAALATLTACGSNNNANNVAATNVATNAATNLNAATMNATTMNATDMNATTNSGVTDVNATGNATTNY